MLSNTIALYIGILASAALAADFQRLPESAHAVFLRAAGQSKCALSETNCICKTKELASAFKDAVPLSCPGGDFITAFKAGCDLCPNLKDLFPANKMPILRAPDKTNAISYYPTSASVWHHYDPVPTPDPSGPAGVEAKQEVTTKAPAATHTGPSQEPTPYAALNDDGNIDNDVPDVYTTPAQFSAQVGTPTINPSDFTGTDTWMYPTTTITGLPTGLKKNQTITQAPPVIGEAADVNWFRVVGMAVAVAALSARITGVLY